MPYQITHLVRTSIHLSSFIQSLPSAIINSVYPKGVSNQMLGKTGHRNIERIKREIADSKAIDLSGVSVFHHVLASPIPESEKSIQRLRAESMIMLLAGTLAGAHTLTFLLYYVLANSEVEKCLRHELKGAGVFEGYPAKIPRWADLENLPYLRGCLREALRLNGLVGNLARCSPDEAVQFREWTIPKNVSVSSSSFDPLVFVWTKLGMR